MRSAGLAAILGLGLGLSRVAPAQSQQTPVPDAPTPQAPPPLPGTDGEITPGSGTQPIPTASNTPAAPAAAAPASPPAPAASTPPPIPDHFQTQTPASSEQQFQNYIINVNFVEVPVTVKDSKGRAVAGLTFRDFKVFENNTREPLSFFSVDPQPLSISFVIDQSLPSNVMDKVNTSLGALQGALAPYDEVAVFTYAHGTKEWTTFTGAQSNRLPAVLSIAENTGTDPTVPFTGGPFGGCSMTENGNCVDPNLQQGHSTGNIDGSNSLPKELHQLNDAILMAAHELSTRPKEYRRIIYVVSDGKEYGSKATWKEVVRYLQTNKIAVYGTLVGESARWGEGWLDRFHLPFEMYDNILYKYTALTGGDLDAESGTNGIEKSYTKIASEARNQYTLGYFSHESIYDAKFRNIDVRVDRPDLAVIAKKGYYPSAQDYK
ncbi:MAG TPA: VWA domain-containing protein [Terracidiphilus sp.]|nr:VWA domain-containing protein [Terracidiphilus sp.]